MLRDLAARRRRGDDRGAAAGAGRGAGAAAAAREAEVEAKVRAVREIARRVAAMPDVSDLTDDEILGYDEDGIPSR